MTTDSATAGPAATGASPAGAVPGPFPPRRDRRPSRRRPWGRPRSPPVPYILPLDEGTTNAKAHAIAPDGSILASGSAAVVVSHPRPGWVERDAEAVWAAQTAAIRDCLAGAVGPRPALRSPTSASPSSSETPSPA